MALVKPSIHTELSLLREELVRQEDAREEWLAQLAALQEELAGMRSSLGTLYSLVAPLLSLIPTEEDPPPDSTASATG